MRGMGLILLIAVLVIALIPNNVLSADPIEPITADTLCPDKCEVNTIYLDGYFDEKLRTCVYKTLKECEFGCYVNTKTLNTVECNKYPELPPTDNETYFDTLWKMMRDLLGQKENEIRMTVHGTEYHPNEDGLLYIQLLDSEDAPVLNSSCSMSLYYPDGIEKWKDKQLMTYSDEGLYFLPFETPPTAGVYMASAFCVVPNPNNTIAYAEHDFNDASFSGGTGNWSTIWNYTGNVDFDGTAYEGAYSMRLRGSGSTFYSIRAVNNTPLSDRIVVTFYARANSIESGEYFYFRVCDYDYGNCTTSKTWADGDDDGVWRLVQTTFTSSNYKRGLFHIVFDGTTNLNTGDYLYIDSLSVRSIDDDFNATSYQFVRGSGEVHVSNGELYEQEWTNFWINESEGDEHGGKIYANLSVLSLSYEDRDTDVTVQVFDYFYCDDIDSVKWINKTSGSWVNITDYVCSRNSETGLDELVFTQTLGKNDVENYQFQMKNNYGRLIHRKYVLANSSAVFVDFLCQYYSAVTGIPYPNIPLNTTHYEPQDPVMKWCIHASDVFYFLEQKYLSSEELNTSKDNPYSDVAVGKYLSLLYEINEDLYPEYESFVAPIIRYFTTSALYSNENVNSIIGYGVFEPFGNQSTIQLIRNAIGEVNATASLDYGYASYAGGTEYSVGETGIVTIQFLRNTGLGSTPLNGGTCYASIYYPNGSLFISNQNAPHLSGSNGLYSYNFTVPSTYGVYRADMNCTQSIWSGHGAGSFHVAEWADTISKINISLGNVTIDPASIWGYYNRTLTDYNLSGVLMYIDEINSSLYLGFENLTNLINSVNTSIHSGIDNAETNILNAISNINGTILAELSSISGDLQVIQDNLTTIYDQIGYVNSTIMVKLFAIQDEITSVNNTIKEMNVSIHTYLDSISTRVDEILYDLDNIEGNITEIKAYVTEINGTAHYIVELLGQVNQSITEYINVSLYELENTLSGQIVSVNSTILSVNNTVMTKLFLLQDELANMSSEIIDYLLNLTNATINITISQEDLLDSMIGLWGDSIGGARGGDQYAYAGFTGFLPLGGYSDKQYYCLDNQTLAWTKTKEVNMTSGQNRTYVYMDKEICTYGCMNNACILPPHVIWVTVILIIAVMFFFVEYFRQKGII